MNFSHRPHHSRHRALPRIPSFAALRSYLHYDRSDVSSFCALTIIFAFILSFTQWGTDNFDFFLGFRNFFFSLLLVGASLILYDSVRRVLAIRKGFLCKLRVWWPGALFCLALAILTNGAVQLFAGASGMLIAVHSRRLGQPNYVEAPRHFGLIALLGPCTSILLAASVRLLSDLFSLNTLLVVQFIYFNAVFAALSMLPIPPLDGSHVFFYKRVMYIFFFSVAVSYLILYLLGIGSLLLSILLACIATLLYMYSVEKVITLK